MKIKLKDIVKIGVAVGADIVPGGSALKSVLSSVNKNIKDESDPANVEALRTLAKVNDEQTEAILALHARLLKLENAAKK